MILCLGEPPVRFFWCQLLFISFLIFILLLFFICQCSLFCCYSSFTFSFRLHPSPFRGLSPGFYTHFILSAQSITEWFTTLSFSTLPRSSFHGFTAGATVLSEHFSPRGVFYLALLHRHFTSVYRGLPGSAQFFLEVSRVSYWSSKHRPGPTVFSIHSNPYSSYLERFIFKFYQIYHELLVVKV